MSITSVRALPAGNALQVFLEPPPNAQFWRVMRVSGPSEVVISEGNDRAPVDALGLANGISYTYRASYWTGSAWIDTGTASGTPAATYADASVDTLSILRDRLEAGLRVEVERGTLSHELGAIPVLLAPPVFEDTRWPVVTIHLNNEQPQTRALGEMMADDVFNSGSGLWTESEGYLADVSLTVMGWSLNADERSALRIALRRLIVANFPVLNMLGIVTPSFSQQDTEDFTTYAAPVYNTMGTFTCQAPVLVADDAHSVTDTDAIFKE